MTHESVGGVQTTVPRVPLRDLGDVDGGAEPVDRVQQDASETTGETYCESLHLSPLCAQRTAHNLRGLRSEVTTDTVGRDRLMRLLGACDDPSCRHAGMAGGQVKAIESMIARSGAGTTKPAMSRPARDDQPRQSASAAMSSSRPPSRPQENVTRK
jgi:hypothetical protein